MAFSWNNLKRPILALAPMAGYTDTAYRQLIKGIEPRVICFTEFTSADGLVYGSKMTLKQLDFNPNEERPLVAQIFGKKPEHFAKAAKIIEEMGIDAIDINMGCPAKKVVSSDHGSALLKKPCRAIELVEATVKATQVPVSVKTRIGSDQLDLPWFVQFCKDLESAGIQLLTIHGRTAKQMYTGKADWEPIYEVKRNLKIPVIGNGDIRSVADAREKLGNLDGVMVGRGTMGNPWLMAEIAADFYGETYVPPKTFQEKLPTYLRHAELLAEYKGEEHGMKEMRKHFVNLIRGFDGASEARAQVVQISTLEEAKRVLSALAECQK
ncbi:tRNA dihydrouridine synthase DusB [Candidatus Peregrinibacteria bacterium]|nr:MAG: tRNA dihydrouridine synthase DusB [Candidatus Peregrinibacteria bacterium]